MPVHPFEQLLRTLPRLTRGRRVQDLAQVLQQRIQQAAIGERKVEVEDRGALLVAPVAIGGEVGRRHDRADVPLPCQQADLRVHHA